MYRNNLRFYIVVFSFYVDLCLTCLSDSGCEIHGTTLLCNKYLNITQKSDDIRVIEICHLNSSEFFLGAILRQFPNLNNLTLKYSAIKKIESRWINEQDKLEVIVLNNVSVTNIDEAIFSKFRNLKMLDLRNNSLRLIHSDKVEHLKRIPIVYLSGNKWNCSKNLDWVYHLNETAVRDLNNLTCYEEPLKGKPLYFISEAILRANAECPPTCECILVNVVRHLDGNLQPIVEVNCSKRNFTTLPDHLPEHAKILKVENNRINDLSPLIKNPIYREVTDLYMDHNLVRSIDLLEGSYWLRNFRVLSLKGNKLIELPTYAMDDALQQNPNMPNAIMLYLGSNPWRCDCVFTPSFQEDILVKYEAQIQDLFDIRCSFVERDENSLLPIVHVSRSSICQLPNEYSIRALDLLNGVLASLIVLVLGKLAYDYYYFKRTGKLPWIVTKMP